MPEDQANPIESMQILLPGDAAPAAAPQGGGDTGAPAGDGSLTGDEENLRAAYEAAGIKPPETKTAAPASTTALTAEQVEFLKGLDPDALPPEVQERLDKKFHAAFTRKTQTLAEKERAFEKQRSELFDRMERLVGRIGGRGEQPGDRDRLADLREKLKSGDYDAIEQYVDERTNQRLDPIESQVRLRNAFDMAAAEYPPLGQMQNEVGQVFNETPVLLDLLKVDKYAYAPFVFKGVAALVHAQKLEAHVQGEAQRTADAVTKALNAYKAKVSGLPLTTTQAATTATAGTTTRKPATTEAEAREGLRDDLRKLGVVI